MPSETKENRPPQARQPRAAPAATDTPPHPKPGAAEPLPCPRCDSRDTKFCYYNNYNLSQPRHFCKGCRRYWTHGGTLRNVPVGGGSRKSSSSKRLRTKPPPTSPAAASSHSPPNSASSSSTSSAVTCSSAITTLNHEPEALTVPAPIKVEGLVNQDANGLYVGLGGFGYGYGLYDAGIGLQPLLGSTGMGYLNLVGGHAGGSASNTWQFLGELEGGNGNGGGDSFAWPGLAISTPADASSK